MTPRGLCPDGTVRTTGWLQAGTTPISSGLWALLGGLFLTIPFAGGRPALTWLPLVSAAFVFGAWKSWTVLVRPASKAVNTRLDPAGELRPGEWVRLYGSAGPVGQVEALHFAEDGQLHLWLVGGLEQVLAAEQPVWRVELRS
ncbi:hypothetical protein GCM10010174_85990 [Kutzneria viridogrisea]|uniref:Uncharacterized protein n=2 Tax=Kutzneria TaxID=43356 RepID=W5WUT7_9PSEU|nr:hypothetical protein [Kutzneria albida]AHI01925.1 hypothetical protein KALB_8568 [Kutzneria albida DSM 43870]MBA8929652.1 hypothetical protein [Kutzneria viridogrisea]